MKRKMIFGTALLTLSLLAGCGAAPAQETTAAPTAAETTLAETMAPTTVPTTPPTTGPETEPPFEVVITPVITQAQTQVTVSTVDEFLAAIAPNTEILLSGELFDLSEAAGYGKQNGEYYFWAEGYDGPELHISNVSNLTIRGTGEDHGENLISSDPRYAYVLMFENCSNIHTVGFTAGHSKEPGYCMGGVLGFRNCQDILVEDCGLFGCGTLGVMGESSKNMQIVNNEIYECSVGGVELSNCDDVNVDGCTFRDLGTPDFPGTEFRVYGCGKVTCNGEDVWDFSPRNR